jgi:23S rRNA (guanosine2251-2'-O)-methyltransferase
VELERRKKTFLQRKQQGIETTQEVVQKRKQYEAPDSAEYLARQDEHSKFVTIFGKKTVRDALRDASMKFRHIYMDEKMLAVNTNVRRSEAEHVVLEIIDLCRDRNIKLIPVDRTRISVISKAGRQDQGVVADLYAPEGSKFNSITDFIKAQQGDSNTYSPVNSNSGYCVLALDQITTPTNMGMIIRSAIASSAFQAILLGPGSVPANNPLVIKASAGTALLPASKSTTQDHNTVFITAKDSMYRALSALQDDGAEIALLAAEAREASNKSNQDSWRDPTTPIHGTKKRGFSDLEQSISLWDYKPPKKCVFVIGGESQGHDPAVEQIANVRIHIPMAKGVESLNCAVTASLVSYAPQLRKANN